MDQAESSQPQNIVWAEEDQGALVGDILGDAFGDDPVMNWAMPAGTNYAKVFQSSAESVYLKHRKVQISNDGNGAAMWLPPGADSTAPSSFLQIIKMLPMLIRHGFKPLHRLNSLQAHFRAHHPKQDHYYLMAIGARQNCQGKGIGSALLKHMLREVDDVGCIAYLESSNGLNVPLYERFGFETFHRAPIPGGGPMIWFMIRQPQG